MPPMSEPSALARLWEQSDSRWFTDHLDRQAHIRNAYRDECKGEFWSLGPHDDNRRRILLWKVPKDNPFYNAKKPQVLKVMFLAYADETIEDRDDILLPILRDIMSTGAKKYST